MTDEQINEALADFSGYWVQTLPISGVVPEYCTDLNAMHVVEKKLDYRQFETYIDELLEVQHEPMLSTARERAKAAMVAIGKWKEAK
jgi:hypothetical protein